MFEPSPTLSARRCSAGAGPASCPAPQTRPRWHKVEDCSYLARAEVDLALSRVPTTSPRARVSIVRPYDLVMGSWIQLFLDTPAESYDDTVRFWSAVTGWQPSAPRGEDGQFVTLLPSVGPAYVKLQAIDGPARIHLDLDSHDRPRAVSRALDLGATDAWTYEDVPVMRSPGGLLFCHTLAAGSRSLVRDGVTILDQVCIDIPGQHWEQEVVFWRELTGRELQQAALPHFARLPSADGPRILLQRLDDADGPVRAHPDLATADRAGDTARHLGLGATLQGTFDFWTVLVAPGGQAYCLTDRDPVTGSVVRRD